MQVTTTARPSAGAGARKEPWLVAFYRSDVGKKWIMALTGIVLLIYVLAHMVGNLKVFLGPEDLNKYGEALRDLGGDFFGRTVLLWIARIGLAVSFALHIVAAYQLAWTARQRRGRVKYESSRHWVASNYASRTMRWTGTIVLLFLIYHLADLTWGTPAPPATEFFERGEIYNNLVASLERPLSAAIYTVANIALGFHIYHGTWSLFQSMGANNPRYNPWRRGFAGLFTAVVVIGNLAIVFAVQAGIVS